MGKFTSKSLFWLGTALTVAACGSTDQTVDQVAAYAGTIGYEVLTSLGARYTRRFTA